MKTEKKPWHVVGALLVAVACGVGVQSFQYFYSGSEQVFSEHRPLQVSRATKQLGEECTEHGGSECLSSFCLHVRPDRNAGYFCSRSCATSFDCPMDWSCAQIYPSAEASFCVPPATWQARVAAARTNPSHPSVTP